MEYAKGFVAIVWILLYLAFAGALMTGVHYLAFTYLAPYHWSLAWSAFLGALYCVIQSPVRALLEVLDEDE
jgi:hypothetical protein